MKIWVCLLTFSVSEALSCDKPAWGSRVIPSLIEIEVDKKEHPKFFYISIPYRVESLVLNSASLQYGCVDEKNKFSFIPLALRKDGKFMKTEVFMNFSKPENWKVHVTYLTERKEEDPIVLDGPAIESWQVLKHNKVKNENANEVGTDAQKDARPF